MDVSHPRMRHRRRTLPFALPLLLGLSGCGYVHVGRVPAPVATVIGDETLLKENEDLRLEKKILQQELALTRAQGEALRTAIQNRTAEGDTTTRLVEKLNATTRELTALRTSYTQLQAERTQSFAATTDAGALQARLGETEEKLAASLRNFTELQREIGRLKSDVARTRAENVALSEKVKTVTAQNQHAQAALAQLNTDFLAQKDARIRAEQDAATLRTELTTVAATASALAHQRTGAAADARSLLAGHAAETASLKQQLDTLRAKVETLTAERGTLVEQLARANTTPAPELANVEARLATALRSESLLRDENAALKESRAQLAEQLAQAKSARADNSSPNLRDQLRETQEQIAALTEENNQLKARLASSESSGRPVDLAAETSSDTSAATRGDAPVSQPTPEIVVRPGGVNATLVTRSQRGTITRHNGSVRTRVHIVASGDTLAKISHHYYGNSGRWGDILAANRDVLGATNNLVIGRMLRIP